LRLLLTILSILTLSSVSGQATSAKSLVTDFAVLQGWQPSTTDTCKSNAIRVLHRVVKQSDQLLAYKVVGEFQGVVAEFDLLNSIGFRPVKTFGKEDMFTRVMKNQTTGSGEINRRSFIFRADRAQDYVKVCVYIVI